MFSSVLFAVAAGAFCYENLDPVPAAPSPSEWTFKAELAEPAVYHAPEAYRIVDEYGLKGETETVRADLDRFMASAGKEPAKALFLRKGAVDGLESYRLDVSANGDVTLTAEDDDGIRRAACHFEDRVLAGDLKPVVRKPWLKNRISRCFFGPIKRPPFNRDELMDDVDYYPDAYLNRLAHEGINGLWLTVELRNIVKTSFNERDKDAPRRIAKLRRTVDKCRRYGIRTWVFCIEPRRMEKDDPLLSAFPPEALSPAAYNQGKVLCTSSAAGKRYLTEAFKDLFEQVPGLPGALNISHGERPTTCLSRISAVNGTGCACPVCSKLPPWQIHWNTSEAIVKGMRQVNPKAEFLSWFYQPYVNYERADWVPEVARHLPEGVTMLYNFESGAVKEQLGRYRPGGDYWLSYTGPSPAFGKVAAASREANGRIGAKIQVGCSHECATVPFVPVPGLLYRKYAEMRKARCSTVMQCWYFGNCPGVMNKAAGELAFSDFAEDEDTFLLNLAKPEWGEDAPVVAKMWKDFSDAYANYPLSNDMQYYGPLHAGVAWPLFPGVEMRRLGRTWKPQDDPSGDVIAECLENHTLDEAAILTERMRVGSAAKDARGNDVIAVLEAKYAGNRERSRDLAVIRALQLLFASGSDILEFYRLRQVAVMASRDEGDAQKALRAVAGMRALIGREKDVTAAMLPLARNDSRLGFHSEAEAHQFHAKKLEWRLKQLDAALRETDRIAVVLASGGTYPLSPHELSAPQIKVGEKVVSAGYEFTVRFLENGDFEIVGRSPKGSPLYVRATDACATVWPLQITLNRDGYKLPDYNVVAPGAVVRSYASAPDGDGWNFRLVLDARGWGTSGKRPGWIYFSANDRSVWPNPGQPGDYRLNLGFAPPERYGRIVEKKTEPEVGGVGLETVKWQAAIDAAARAGGGRVTVPAGEHVVGQLDLRSNVELHLEDGAVLCGAYGLENYRVVALPHSEGTWSAVVMGINVTNVAITGKGTINGRGDLWSTSIPCPKGVCKEGLRPRGVFFGNCRGVRLEDFTLRDAVCWGVVFKCCDGVVARRVRIDSHANWNNDGFDVEAKNVLIADCDVDAGDDAICIKSNDPDFVVENVVVTNCIARSHCNGLKLGTASHGTMRNIRFYDCRTELPKRNFTCRGGKSDGRMAYAHRATEEFPLGVGSGAVNIENVDGGTVEDVVFDGIEANGFQVPIFIRGGKRMSRTCGIPRGTANRLERLVIRNLTGTACGEHPNTITGVDACPVRDVVLENVRLVCRGSAAAPVGEPGTEYDGRYPDATMFAELHLPAYGLYANHVSGLKLDNVEFVLRPGDADARPPVFRSETKGR